MHLIQSSQLQAIHGGEAKSDYSIQDPTDMPVNLVIAMGVFYIVYGLLEKYS